MADTRVEVLRDADALARAAADWFEMVVGGNEGIVSVCLTGGSTPERLYTILSDRDLPWDRIHVFWGDERFVPRFDPHSNASMTHRALLDRVPIPSANIHSIPTDTVDPEAAAEFYEAELKSFYGAERLSEDRPLFDLVINGIGPDGHMASLFPHASALSVRDRWVVSAEPGMEPHVPRVTLTYPALESCRAAAFLVSGAGKKDILSRVLLGEDFPAARFKPQGPLTWFTDRSAAGL